MAEIQPYLTFNGNCEAAFNFYKSVFESEFTYIGRFNEMPPNEGKPISPEQGNLIMHVSLPIGENSVLMGSDTSEHFGPSVTNGSNFSLSINAKSEEEAKKLFDALAKEGQITMPLDKTFWGALFGMLIDSFGIQWMVNFDYETKSN